MHYRFLRFPGGKAKAVTLSYDDGRRTDIRMTEILSRYGIKCTFNVNSGLFGKDDQGRYLTADEIQQHMVDRGHEIAVHGHFHMAPGLARPIDMIQDVLADRIALETRYGRIIRGMAYPDSGITRFQNGADYETIRACLQNLGIVYARTLGGDNSKFLLPADWFAWMPTAHHNNPELMAYVDKFLEIQPDDPQVYYANRYPRLFYLWGHSFEYQNNNNWHILEDFCEKISGRDDIWYATNIEIYNYVHAYDSLVFSADGTRVYNPSLMTVWFRTDDKQYCIHSGETLVLE